VDLSLEELSKKSFSGRTFKKETLQQIIDTVNLFPNLTRQKLAHTLCDHLSWLSPAGSYKTKSCLSMLEKLEKLQFVCLPVKEHREGVSRIPTTFSIDSDAKENLDLPLELVEPIELVRVSTKEDLRIWREFMERYHYLGYRQPVGSKCEYFIVSKKLSGQRLGCISFTSHTALHLKDRDEWIGWDKKQRQRNLGKVICNNRFLIFPWVKIHNLASKVLSGAVLQIQKDWLELTSVQPVLIETFVKPSIYKGTCYKAANWQWIGKTAGSTPFRKKSPETSETPPINEQGEPKDIYLYPLTENFREALLQNSRRKSDPKINTGFNNENIKSPQASGYFLSCWDKISSIITAVALEYDCKWMIRKRTLNSLLLILIIFRLVFSKNSQAYATSIADLWDNCKKLNIPLPKETPIAASALTKARLKLDEQVFKDLNDRILSVYGSYSKERFKWNGFDLFAVDGSHLNVPKELLNDGFNLPNSDAYYPQGLLSTLYQLHSKIPYDFEFESHKDERRCAMSHLKRLTSGDLVIYDRGYFSYALLYRHHHASIPAVFRLKETSNNEVEKFVVSLQTDAIITIQPEGSTKREIQAQFPDILTHPIQMRVIKYRVENTVYYLGTTLLDQSKYPHEIFSDLYHARWGVEELYKTSKQVINIEDFHAKSKRGIRQEVFAHFVLITLSRIFSNEVESQIPGNQSMDLPLFSLLGPNHANTQTQPQLSNRITINFKNAIHSFFRNLESFTIDRGTRLHQSIGKLFQEIRRQVQKLRPNRTYARVSHKPLKKFRPSNRQSNAIQLKPAYAV